MKTILLAFLFILHLSVFGQGQKFIRCFDSLNCNSSPFENSDLNIQNCPSDLKIPIAIVLNHYPELKAKKIIFKKAKITTTLNARPTFGSLLFVKKTNRSYVIRINSSDEDSVILLNQIPLNAKIGLLAHEFSHFEDYQKRSVFGVLARGLAYSNKRAKAKFEKEIDLSTIQHGLGWQLYDWSDFVLNQSKASTLYKAFKAETYMKPHEIKSCIEQLLVQ